MTRRICVLLAVLLMITLAACTPKYEIEEAECPTLPSFSQELTPQQQLESGLGKTENEPEYEIRYGMICKSGEETTENEQVQRVDPNGLLDRQLMYEQLPYLPNNEAFLQEFCNRRLQAVPSNTGVIRYQLTDLGWEDAHALLYARTPEAVPEEGVWGIFMDLDANGRFSRLEITVEMEEELFTAFLRITFPDGTDKE